MKTKQIILFAIVLFFAACNETETAQQASSQDITTQETQDQQEVSAESAATEITLETANLYVPNGFRIVVKEEEANLLIGDFNGDKIQDFALMVASNETNEYQEANDVRVIIYEGDGTKFTEKARSGNLGGFFVHDAPTSQLALTKNVISLQYQGMRYDDEWKLRFDEKYGNYMLIGSEHNYYGTATNDGSGNVSSNYLAGVRLENLNKWNEKKEELIELPEKKTKLSKTLLPLSKLAENNYSDL
jgi:hypothetical protein